MEKKSRSTDPLAAFGGVSPFSRGRMNLLSPSSEGETPPKAARGSTQLRKPPTLEEQVEPAG